MAVPSADDVREASNFAASLKNGDSHLSPDVSRAVSLLASEARRMSIDRDGQIPDQKKLFVGGLPLDIREEEVRMIFETYGPVDRVAITDSKPPAGTKIGFVTYTTEEGAHTAVQALNEVYKFRLDAENPIKVSIQRPKRTDNKGGGGTSWSSSGNDWGSGYNNNNKSDWQGGGGGGGSSWSSNDRGQDRQGGGWNSSSYGNDRGNYGNDRGNQWGGGGGGRNDYGGKGGHDGKGRDKGGDGKSAGPGPKIHISNLPKDIQQEALKMVFSTYGTVSDIHILPAKGDNVQMAAFLTYTSADAAKTAIDAMEGGYEIRPGEGNIIVKYARAGGKGGGYDSGDRYKPY